MPSPQLGDEKVVGSILTSTRRSYLDWPAVMDRVNRLRPHGGPAG
jgi:hypothetical protein